MNVASITTGVVAPPRAVPASPFFDPEALRRAPAEQQRAAAASQFEAVLVRQFLGKTVDSVMGGGGPGGQVYGDLLAQTLSQQLAGGRGLGLGTFIQQQIAPPARAERSPDGQGSFSPR